MKLALMVAELPPRIDGIGDYTARLAEELARTDTVTVYTNDQRAHDPIPGVAIVPAFRYADTASVGSVFDRLAADPPDWFVLQYNPFAYGKWGRNGHLPRLIWRIRRRLPQTRVAIMFHERHVPLRNNSVRFRVMATWQLPQFWALSKLAQRIFFSTDAWVDVYQRALPKTPVRPAGIGSAVRDVGLSRQEARARLGLPDDAFVLGFFGSAHISKMLDYVAAAAKTVRDAGIDARVLYLGADVDAMREALGDIPLIADGALPPDELSRRFAAMDIQLCAFTDGISTRRSSMMVGLEHGVATLGTRGPDTTPIFEQIAALSPLKDRDAFAQQALALARDPARRAALGAAGRAAYAERWAYPVLAARFRADLIGG